MDEHPFSVITPSELNFLKFCPPFLRYWGRQEAMPMPVKIYRKRRREFRLGKFLARREI
jgi:hypothetical protein